MAKDLELFERQAKGELDVYTLEKPHVRTDGSVGWARISSTAVRGPSGEFQYAVPAQPQHPAQPRRLSLSDRFRR